MQVQIVTLTNSLYTEKTVLSTYMLTLFNIVFEARYFPVSWSDGFVIPLHKKKSVNDVYNYRGIALLSTLGTHFTRVLNNVLHGILNHVFNKGKQLFCDVIAFSKAFDYLNRDNVWKNQYN